MHTSKIRPNLEILNACNSETIQTNQNTVCPASITNHTTRIHLQTKESVHIHQTSFPSQIVGSRKETTGHLLDQSDNITRFDQNCTMGASIHVATLHNVFWTIFYLEKKKINRNKHKKKQLYVTGFDKTLRMGSARYSHNARF